MDRYTSSRFHLDTLKHGIPVSLFVNQKMEWIIDIYLACAILKVKKDFAKKDAGFSIFSMKKSTLTIHKPKTE